MRLLLVEDNNALAERIVRHVPAPYAVTTAATGRDAILKVSRADYSLVVLDLGLPDITGIDVCRHIRRSGNHVPILILTGLDDMPTRISLLESGADDYMTKPFDAREFVARIDALGRRQPLVHSDTCLTVGDLVVDYVGRRVSRGGEDISLRRKEFDILEYLVRNRGKVVTREMIINNVWDAPKKGWANTVDVHIKSLRDKIDRPFSVPLIKTAYGIGYRVEAPEDVMRRKEYAL